ncbi:MAG: MoxR family ATPase [Dehalococcoidia bacterium]|nr:MoxR family ATPase [Dehalococcoidia bacterium]
MSKEFVRRARAVVENVRSVVVADTRVIRLCLMGLLCQGHVLLDDFPGVGKTLLAKALAQSLQTTFNRIQFTPDLLPTDITGSSIYYPNEGSFKFMPGPIFANIVLADEINRSSPRTQSALLEAMGEGFVTFDGVSHPLPRPFFVIATRNLSEAHGVFPLPQSQLDRFLLSLGIGYPDLEQQVEILDKHEHGESSLKPVLTSTEIVEMQEQISLIQVARPVKEYIASIVAETRVNKEIVVGVSPRGAVFLQRAAQAEAAMEDRSFVTPDDIKKVALPVLRHRIVPRSSAHDASTKSLESILSSIPVPL